MRGYQQSTPIWMQIFLAGCAFIIVIAVGSCSFAVTRMVFAH